MGNMPRWSRGLRISDMNSEKFVWLSTCSTIELLWDLGNGVAISLAVRVLAMRIKGKSTRRWGILDNLVNS